MKDNILSKTLKSLMYYSNKRTVDIVNNTIIPRPTVYKIVTGETKNPKPQYLSELANYFNVTTDQLRGLTPIEWNCFAPSIRLSFHKSKQLPVYLWEKYNEWQNELLVSGEKRFITTNKIVSSNSFALEIRDSSMEPLFNKGAIIIIDTEIQFKNGAYVIAKINNISPVVCRQLVIDIDKKYLKP